MPVAVADNSDIVHVAYPTNEGNQGQVVAYRNSADGFATPTYASPYGGTNSYLAITIDPSNTKYIFTQTTANFTLAGLNLYKGTSSYVGQMISPPLTGGASVLSDTAGNIWVTYLSSEYCAFKGCDILNLAARPLSGGTPTLLTQFSSPSTIIGNFQLIAHPTGEMDLLYDSNEFNAAVTNVALRHSADNFSTAQFVTKDTSASTSLGNAALDPLGVIHLSMSYGGSLIGYTTQRIGVLGLG